MKNIWRIFSGDMKRLVRNPFALVIAIGLCIIPSLYAWFNIYSNWDPYANTKNIKIAVATEDTGYQMDDGTTVNMGDSVIESLKENDKIGWVFTDTKDAALEGVYSGDIMQRSSSALTLHTVCIMYFVKILRDRPSLIMKMKKRMPWRQRLRILRCPP